MSRGRLIFPYMIELAQLDTVATFADPDGAGELTSGYDQVFREPAQVPDTIFNPLNPDGDNARKETTIFFPAQVQFVDFDKQQMLSGVPQRGGSLSLWAHFETLEGKNMVRTSTNAATINVNDRLVAIHEYLPGDVAGDLIQKFDAPHYDLRCVSVMPRGWGLTSLKRNLLKLSFEDRMQGK